MLGAYLLDTYSSQRRGTEESQQLATYHNSRQRGLGVVDLQYGYGIQGSSGLVGYSTP